MIAEKNIAFYCRVYYFIDLPIPKSVYKYIHQSSHSKHIWQNWKSPPLLCICRQFLRKYLLNFVRLSITMYFMLGTSWSLDCFQFLSLMWMSVCVSICPSFLLSIYVYFIYWMYYFRMFTLLQMFYFKLLEIGYNWEWLWIVCTEANNIDFPSKSQHS